MFSRPITRSTYAPPPFSIPTSPSRACTNQLNSSSRSHLRHSRRPSSSKASCPPGSPKGAEENTNNTSSTSGQSDKREKERRANGAVTKRKTKATSTTEKDPYFKVPAVPSTDYLKENDIFLSSLFALHRPISVTKTIPPTTTAQAFDSIFEARPERTHRPQDVIRTLSSAVSSFENASPTSRNRRQSGRSQQNDSGSTIGWDLLQPQQVSQSATIDANGTTHLDEQPMPSLNDLLARFRPFQTPPPPVPHDQITPASSAPAQDMPESRPADSSSSIKTYRATLTLSEEAHHTGSKTYTTRLSPLVPTSSSLTPFRASRQPFLSRMKAREEENIRLVEDEVKLAEQELDLDGMENEVGEGSSWGVEMDLISVKRQRKLKMKKHKYKKLMRRTRNLRRRLGR
ncbi:MAG: hypothetical protein M1828_004070 [Chrysothrix sp. TS-e1954]|nr:MAG: hypothetical protein M1828_004070 [Chrysothrix sp. TS-e1954]